MGPNGTGSLSSLYGSATNKDTEVESALAGALRRWQHVRWSLDALTGLLVAAKDEDRLGVVTLQSPRLVDVVVDVCALVGGCQKFRKNTWRGGGFGLCGGTAVTIFPCANVGGVANGHGVLNDARGGGVGEEILNVRRGGGGSRRDASRKSSRGSLDWHPILLVYRELAYTERHALT